MSTNQSVAEFLASLEKEKANSVEIIKKHQQLVAELDALIPGIRARFKVDPIVKTISCPQ